MWRRVSHVLVGLSFMTACAAATEYGRPQFSGARRELLTAAEIVGSRVTDVYQAVSQLRPEFLRRRVGAVSFTPVAVQIYLDELPLGPPESLRLIPLGQVRMIRYMTPVEADLRFGGRHAAGAILVTTLK